MRTQDKYKDIDFNLAQQADNIIPGKLIAQNYANVYKTTGGGRSVNKAISFTKKFIDNRVLDIYLKILGITTLTPATLVPMALIFGQQAFQKSIKYLNKAEQKGGTIPIFDHNLLGTYLKIAGITQLSLTLNTLLPLGFLMAIYEAYKVKHKKNKKRSKTKHKGGSNFTRLFVGENVPPGNLQILNGLYNGKTFQNNIYAPLNGSEQAHRSYSYIDLELQNFNNNLSLQSKLPDVSSMTAPVNSIDGNSSQDVSATQNGSISVESETGFQVPQVMA